MPSLDWGIIDDELILLFVLRSSTDLNCLLHERESVLHLCEIGLAFFISFSNFSLLKIFEFSDLWQLQKFEFFNFHLPRSLLVPEGLDSRTGLLETLSRRRSEECARPVRLACWTRGRPQPATQSLQLTVLWSYFWCSPKGFNQLDQGIVYSFHDKFRPQRRFLCKKSHLPATSSIRTL